MGYSNIINVQNILAQSLTTGTNETPGGSTPGSLIEIGRVLKTNLVTEDIVDQYIQWADNQIDGVLGSIYNVPFCKRADFETKLLANIPIPDPYDPYATPEEQFIIIDKACSFNVGDEIVLIENGHEETHVIYESLGNGMYAVEDEIAYGFTTAARLLRVTFVYPITLISSRLAAANIYEKYFAAQTAPQQSDYGKIQKQLATNDLNNILNGRIVLRSEHKIGYRFVNSELKSKYHLPSSNIDGNTNLPDIV